MTEVVRSVALFTPEIALTAGLLLVVLVDASGASWRNAVGRFLTVATLALALVLALRLLPAGSHGASIFSGMVVVDPLGLFFKVVLLTASLLTVLLFTFRNSRELFGLGHGEFYALLLAVTLSNLLMAAANDIVMLYLSLEMVSITSYVMVAYMKGDRMSNEASLKYLLFGAVSTGAMLYGLSLLYGMAGTTALPSVAPKAAGFAIMLRFFFGSLAQAGTGPWDLAGTIDWPQLLMVVSVLTMTVGNVAALTQTNMKRLLAYSSIAHAGYIMMGVVALSENGARGMMIYLLAYLFMNLGAFLVVTLIHNQDGTFDLRDYPGLYRRAPFLTAAMAIFLLSLVGIPPFVGFMGKLYVFAAIVERGPEYWWYAVAAAVNAAIAA